jgi:predicted dehydrogenase/threonine dehydrogenase-like Zn-dependent dehydrogenase
LPREWDIEMRQVGQRARGGGIEVVETPSPALRPGFVVVANRCSLVSAGTERSKLELAEKSLLQKARARPDLVKKVVERARAEGISSTFAAARERLDSLAPLGYSCAGDVMRVAPDVEGLQPGDRVACAGGGFANHAEVVAVPKNLVARVPAGVPYESAAYATVGAIALHGVRRAEAQVSERIGVVGLGLVGQLAVRILMASGCTAYGIDIDPEAVELAATGGAQAFARDRPGLEASVLAVTEGVGLDAVLICAATTSNDPTELAARLVRERGRIVIVGDVPVEADRRLMYEKELELRLSRSYGPGRYDRDYEERGRDLPHAYVRWTEQRNLQAFLELVGGGKFDPAELTTHRFPVERAQEAYAALTAEGGRRPFGIVLEYRQSPSAATAVPPTPRVGPQRGARIALVGAGSFARRTLIPGFRAEGAGLVAVTTESGLTAEDVASRFGFERAAASAEELLKDDSIDAVVIATRHSTHSQLVAEALRAGKAVFVEKPLALDEEGLLDVVAALDQGGPLMVGFNRRFAPLVTRLREALEGVPVAALLVRVNAGALPSDHWLNDREVGGGRLLGEGCHFVDLLAHVANSRAAVVYADAARNSGRPIDCSDDVTATIRFANGATGALLYSGSGDARMPKERLEVFGGGLAAALDDFRKLEIYHDGRRRAIKGRQDKGHRAEIATFLRALRGDTEPPPVQSYLDSTRATLALAESLRTGLPVDLGS